MKKTTQNNYSRPTYGTDGNSVQVKYILSSAGGGHGDDLWAASRHIANIFADDEKCREILGPAIIPESINENHILMGSNFVELGAGAGVPSWTALKCCARVVCTDQSIPDRILCIAESAERSRRVLSAAVEAITQ